MDTFMALAIQVAKNALAAGDYPFGSVLVRGDQIIGVGRNRMNTNNDPTSHAEIEVLRSAGLQESYTGMVMYASAFPCISSG